MFENKLEFKQSFDRRLSEKYGRSIADSHITERYNILGSMVRDYAGYDWRHCREDIQKNNKKQVIYFSMEFLMGRLLLNNMQNLGIYKVAKEGLADYGIDINELEDMEPDAGLGNGGLGRLAACFLDSSASLGYPVHGNTIRYDYGFFRQKFVNGKQIELPDQWLSNGFIFEVRKPKHSVEVQFGGRAETFMKEDGTYGLRTTDATFVRAVPYDVSVVGYKNGVSNSLRLWGAEPSENHLPSDESFVDYLDTLRELTFGLYPDDSTEHGRLLRLRQQYFLVSSGLQSCMRGYKRKHENFDEFYKYFMFQLNDTHPILAIPEMMRLLMDEYGYGWDDAWNIVSKCFAYTNHTIMPEALEKWPTRYIKQLLPRIYMIIEEIDRRFNNYLAENQIEPANAYAMRIIKDGQVHMTNMAIVAAVSVNGVAKLHTDILKAITFRAFYELFPYKFNCKTNGVTHRRWLLYSNEHLADLITKKIGKKWIREPLKLEEFDKFADDKKTQKAILEIKQENKVAFADFVEKTYGLKINPKAIFDVQIKRLHAYKRQLLNVFHIMSLYLKLKQDPENFKMEPHVFIFGAKAAPSYDYAKKIIELILAVENTINNDPVASKFMQIVFVENYGVTLAEKIIPAADLSEQISTAGKEASGTSNMKLMMNGAITIGTLDGANIEIADLAGRENEILFGLTSEEVQEYYRNGQYNPWDIYNSNETVKAVMDSLFIGPWCNGDNNRFRMIFDEIMNRGDEYFILKDFDSYADAQRRAEEFYKDKSRWAESCIHNIAHSGFFSSDRTIEQYNNDIWHLEKYEVIKND